MVWSNQATILALVTTRVVYAMYLFYVSLSSHSLKSYLLSIYYLVFGRSRPLEYHSLPLASRPSPLWEILHQGLEK